MHAEDLVPSAPRGVDLPHPDGRIFEQLRRPNVGSRYCTPCDLASVAIDRIVHDGRACLLFHPDPPSRDAGPLRRDLVDCDLSAVGFAARHEAGQRGVLTDECPGVRLRALVEALAGSGASLPRDVVWHIVRRSGELRAAWQELDAEPGDTFVGFDGSLHLFPRLRACWEQEMPSFNGDEVLDSLVIDDSAGPLGQVLGGSLPPPFLSASVEQARIMSGSDSPATRRLGRRLLARACEEFAAMKSVVQPFLAGPPPGGDAVPTLAALVQRHFPGAHARHRRIYASLGWDLAGHGLAREAKILALRRSPRPGTDADDAWSTYRTRVLAALDADDLLRAPATEDPDLAEPGARPRGSWWSRAWSRLRARH